jgi:arylsulfatase A-like enzyme
MLMRWPGHVAPAVDRRLVANIDVAPTVLDAVGIEPPQPMDGRSLLTRARRRRLLLEVFGTKKHAHLRWDSTITRRHQYVEYLSARGKVIAKEYYDLRSDPWQLRNLLGDDRRANDPPLARLSRRLARDRRCEAGACP